MPNGSSAATAYRTIVQPRQGQPQNAPRQAHAQPQGQPQYGARQVQGGVVAPVPQGVPGYGYQGGLPGGQLPGYGVVPGYGVQAPQQQHYSPAQQRDLQRQQYAAAQQHYNPAANAYQQWQQAGVPQPQQVQAGYAPQGPYQAPALQQAFQQGLHQQLPQYAQQIQHFASHMDEQSFQANGVYNPQAFGGWQGIAQQVVPDPRNRVFDNAGHINAHDNKEALQQIQSLMNHASRVAKQARFQRQASTPITAERREMIAAAVRDQEGFQVLGQQLLLPIKDLLDYEGWARKLYRVRALGQGELFRIAKDVRSAAWTIGQDGQGIESRLYGRYVTPSEFKIGSFPTVDIEEIYQMNYDVLDRAQSTARQEIELEEDKRALALIDVASQTFNPVVSFGSLGVGAFEDVRYQVERHRLIVEKFLINRAELSDVVKTMSSQVDPVTERELLLAGYIGSFLNAVIITAAGTGVEEVVPAGTIYALTGPDTFGEMGIRVELFSEPFNMFSQFRFVKGWALGEILGFCVANARSCAKGRK